MLGLAVPARDMTLVSVEMEQYDAHVFKITYV